MHRLAATLRAVDLSDEYLCAGVSLVFLGVWCIYPPAALITLGLIFGWLAIVQGGAA